jgi:hypothetical protein
VKKLSVIFILAGNCWLYLQHRHLFENQPLSPTATRYFLQKAKKVIKAKKLVS